MPIHFVSEGVCLAIKDPIYNGYVFHNVKYYFLFSITLKIALSSVNILILTIGYRIFSLIDNFLLIYKKCHYI
ncbi:MAG: hypothetical protein A2277_03800 [Desulfobacterales bacterium RIFOXYA12_FULL_46_15]|nr:MAG: hypothetical protein A2097_12060 [Desulfobacula sp. GWF2_41_7]OGR22612.1 MAG: hypothetical protein A2277_03800 [Desulfobacterales bacterium RIFOXYA12_FULL_46_15]